MLLKITGPWKGELNVPDNGTVLDLKLALSAASGVPLDGIKCLLSGRQLKEDAATLQSVGAATGKTVMLMATYTAPSPTSPTSPVKPVTAALDEARARQAEIERLAGAARELGARDPIQWRGRGRFQPELTNQDGTPVRLAEAEQSGLVEGMMLHAKASYMLRQVERSARRRARPDPSPPLAGTTTGGAQGEEAQGEGEEPAPSTAGAAQEVQPGESAGTASSTDSAASEELDKGALTSALALMLRADEAFARVPARFLALLDNPPRLWLDIVWTYYRLGDTAHMADAEQYLTRAVVGFTAAHGADLSRLVQLKGPTGSAPDRLLYVRMHALQGIINALKGDTGRASMTLRTAQSECNALSVRDGDLAMLQSMGYSIPEARKALRMAAANALARGGPAAGAWSGASADSDASLSSRIESALSAALDAREAAQTAANREAQGRANRERVARYGSTVAGHTVNVKLVDAMMSLGFEEPLCVEAARQSDNDQAASLQLLTGGVELLVASIAARHEEEERRQEQKRQAKEARRLERAIAASLASSSAGAGSVGDAAGQATEGSAAGEGEEQGGAPQQGAAGTEADTQAALEALQAAEYAGGDGSHAEEQQDDEEDEDEEEEAEDEDEDEALFELAEALASGRADEERWLTHPDPLQLERQAIESWLARLGHAV